MSSAPHTTHTHPRTQMIALPGHLRRMQPETRSARGQSVPTAQPRVRHTGTRPSEINRAVLRNPVPLPTPPAHRLHGPLHRMLGLDASKLKSAPRSRMGEEPRIPNPDQPYQIPNPLPERRTSPRIIPQEPQPDILIPAPGPQPEPFPTRRIPTPPRDPEREGRLGANVQHLFGSARYVPASVRENPAFQRAQRLLREGKTPTHVRKMLGKQGKHAIMHSQAAANRERWHAQRKTRRRAR